MKPNNNLIAVICIILGGALTVFIFSASRNDPGLRMAALVSATSVVASVIAIASVILTGKDVSHTPPDLPPNSSMQQTTTVKTETPPAASNGSDSQIPKS